MIEITIEIQTFTASITLFNPGCEKNNSSQQK